MLIKTALRNLTRNTRRTAAVLITVALGTGSLFIFHGFNAGIMNQYAENTIHARYGHGQLNETGYRDQVYEKPWEHWISGWEEMKPRLARMPGVTHLFPRIQFFSLLTNGRITVSGFGQGVDGPEESEFFHMLNVVKGRTLSGQPDGIVIGRGLARALDVQPGDRVTLLANTIHGSLNAADLTVSGVFHTGSKEFDDRVFRIQLPQAQRLLDTKLVESIAVGLDATGSWPEFAAAAEETYSRLEAVPFAVLDKVYYQHSVDWLDSQFGVIQFIILAIAVLGIFNTVSTGVLERKQEIGNLRANGESVGDVMKLLLTEGLALGVLGALAGVVLVWALNSTLLSQGILMPPAPGLTRQFHVRVELQWLMALQVFLMGAASALAATFFASFRVARMPIGEAMRSV